MKRPTWATIVGVLAIIFGIIGVFGGAQEMAMPSMVEMQKQMMTSLSQGKTPDGETAPKMTLEMEKDGNVERVEMSQLFEAMEDKFKIPDWYESWAIVFGIVSMIVAGLYLLAGIFLLMTKQSAIKVFYIAIALSVAWAVFEAAFFSRMGSAILMAKIPGSIASIVIDVILVFVVFIGSKEAFVERGEGVHR